MGAALFISYSPGGGLLFYEEKWEKEFLSQIGGRLRRGAKPVRLAAGALLLYVRVVAGCAPCRVTPLTLGVTLQRSAAPPFPGGPCVPPGAPYQNTLGAVPQAPPNAQAAAGYERCESIVRTAPQIRSQGAYGTLYFGFSRDRIKNQPYKRRRVGRNLRLSRADPALCSGQPSPLRCILLSPQGLTTLRGPRLYGVYRRVGFLGRSPE